MNITQATLTQWRKQAKANPALKLAMNAATKNGIVRSALDVEALKLNVHEYSMSLKTGAITAQMSSGRCWMFAALNAMRFDIMSKLNLETYELSQTYPLFWDKLEKSNYFLENILQTLAEDTGSRVIAWLLAAPLGDGGQFDMFAGLVAKYGVVPKDAMPETACSSNTREMDKFLTLKLREFACRLRSDHANGTPAETLRIKKESMLAEIYRMLCVSLGFPPEKVGMLARDKDGTLVREDGLTPQEFYQQYIGWDLSEYVSLINAPTDDKPYNRPYTVRFLGSVHEARPVKYLNLPIEELKRAAIAQMKDGRPVWFGCDVGQWLVSEQGVMDVDAIDVAGLFGTDFPLTKAQRLDYGESLMTHAMVLLGVHLTADGKPVRWRVENSWGKDSGKDGYYLMSDKWFDEYTYQVVVHRKYLTPAQQQAYDQDATILEPWDPMGSLA